MAVQAAKIQQEEVPDVIAYWLAELRAIGDDPLECEIEIVAFSMRKDHWTFGSLPRIVRPRIRMTPGTQEDAPS